ncbi:Rad17 cell cycle checkpoint protein-domain-containing protein [Dichotomopilus funicola]|uniref:Rad17 cell cycle checkpoint protein-domain-containing protein n=1 Tax=Dichotomopilus funicola TaxID=1934379 RepID=A0AAN6V0M2_9PEZI|nr:Rad17 cell cycle checkpoint protein-domain-containing protein [Dichotomopilus funicola]
MAPPPKRRKRAIVESDSDDNDHNNETTTPQNKNTIQRFLFSSPSKPQNSPSKPTATTPSSSSLNTKKNPTLLSPTPARKRPTTTTSFSQGSPSPSPRKPSTAAGNNTPLKSRTRAGTQRKRKAAAEDAAEAGGRSGNLLTLFSKQARAQQLARDEAGGSSQQGNGIGSGGNNNNGIGNGKGRRDEIVSDPISEGNGNGNGDGQKEEDDDDVPLMVSSASAAASSLVGRAKAAQRRFGAPAGTANGSGNGNGSVVGKKSAGRNGNGDGASENSQSFGSQGSVKSGGQRFLRPTLSANNSSTTMATTTTKTKPVDINDNDARPWSERFAPVNLDELAVHKRKVQDVRRWLDDVFSGRIRQRLLILKGAAGSGKTTTVRLLARDMRCEVLEWRNPANSYGLAGHGYQSAAAQFEEFLGRGGKFGQLDFESDDAGTPPPTAPPPAPASGTSGSSTAEKRLILVEEFPNTFMRSSTGLTGFRNAIIQFLAANMPALSGFGSRYNAEPVTPIVMVISETLLTTTSASADSFTAHRLLGPEILRHPGTGVIEFNPVAPTFLSKALELIVQKEARKSGRRRTPGPLVLQRLGEIGDIRNAISSLEFLCLKGDGEADWGSKIAFTKPKRGAKDVPALTKGEQDSLELVSQREATLGIFHAVGKVVYNKRGGALNSAESEEANAAANAEILPSYMTHLARPKRSEVAVDSLIGEIGTDTHTFISALHENYALSCEQTSPADPNSSMDYLNGCLDYLSDSDLLYPSWDIFFGGGSGKGSLGGNGGGGYAGKDSGSHVLRQDEMAFQVAVRGLLFSLPSPVKRKTHPTPTGGGGYRGGGGGGGGGAGDAHKMFYPTYLKLWRSKEELEGLVDMWATRMLKGDSSSSASTSSGSGSASGSTAFRRPVPNGTNGFSAGNKSQTSINVFGSPRKNAPLNTQQQPQSQLQQQQTTPLLSLGSAARQELLLERLPYMAHIARRPRPPTARSLFNSASSSIHARDLDRIVSFQGIGALGASEADEDDEADAGDENVQASGRDPGSGGGDSVWATDRPNEDGGTPRKKRNVRRVGLGGLLGGRGNGSGSGNGNSGRGLGGMQSLVISDDDIEDD